MSRKKILAQDIAERIMAMINEEKRFQPGDKLPNENVLSQELHISRNTLREAIRILNTYGILAIERGRGTFVTDVAVHADLKSKLNPFTNLQVDVNDFWELFEMRLILEPEAAYLAAKRGTDEEIHHIIELNQIVEQQILCHQDRTAGDQAFHAAIVEASHNRYMNLMIPALYKTIGTDISLVDPYIQPGESAIIDHRIIAEFLEKRDPEGARSAMKIHMHHRIKEFKF